MAIFLGIDIGTSATKTIAIDAGGNIVAEASHPYASAQPKPTWSEQNPADWWTGTVQSVRLALKDGNLNGADVKAIGLSGQMHGAVFLDKNHDVIRPAILWNDQRTVAECDEMELLCGGREGLVKLVANRAISGFTAPKILWVRKNEAGNFDRTEKILLPKDYVRLRLTGEFATDVSDASGTLLLDVANRCWSKELLTLLDLSESLFPRCYESPEITGKLTAAAAAALGISPACVVVAGAGDCPAGAVGTGIVTTGALSTSIGTSSVMMVHSDSCEIDPAGRIHTVCHAVPGKWLMMGVNLSGGGCLQWFRNQLCKTDLANTGKSTNFYELLSQEAAKTPTGSEGLVFLPYLSGERTPHFDADARGCFIGLTLSHTRGHMVRAIMEGVAYNMSESLEIIRALRVPVHEIRASGGGSQSRLWRQVQADAFGQSVVSLYAEQGPAYGVALLAAVGCGSFSSIEEACGKTIRIVSETQPKPANVEYYRQVFPAFRSLYANLSESFKHIANIEAARDGSKQGALVK